MYLLAQDEAHSTFSAAEQSSRDGLCKVLHDTLGLLVLVAVIIDDSYEWEQDMCRRGSGYAALQPQPVILAAAVAATDGEQQD